MLSDPEITPVDGNSKKVKIVKIADMYPSGCHGNV